MRQLLRTAENSVVIGFTGTPLCDAPRDAELLKALIKGGGPSAAKGLLDEGFISFYMGSPASVFPAVLPRGLPSSLPSLAVRSVTLRNFLSQTRTFSGRKHRNKTYKVKGGNRAEYLRKHNEALFLPRARKGPHATMRDVDSDMDLASLSRLCSLGQACNFAARADVAAVVHGSPGRLLRFDQPEYLPFGSRPQVRRASGYTSKLQAVVEDLARDRSKTLVMIHRQAGFKLLLRMVARRFGTQAVCGYPNAKTWSEKEDPVLSAVLGPAHDEAKGRDLCPCRLCVWNRSGDGGPRVMVADAKECGEGISFLGGVRRLLLVDVPTSAVELQQRVGRAIRFLSHAHLPPHARTVTVLLYQATLKRDSAANPTADQVLIERLAAKCASYAARLASIGQAAFDHGMWQADGGGGGSCGDGGDDGGGGDGGGGGAAAGGSSSWEDRPRSGVWEDDGQASDPDDDGEGEEDEGGDNGDDDYDFSGGRGRSSGGGGGAGSSSSHAPPPPPPPQYGGPAPPTEEAPPTCPTAELPASEAIECVLAVQERHYANPHTKFYKMLGLPNPHEGYTRAVRKSYLLLVRVLHPDKTSAPQAELASKFLISAHDDVEC